MEKGTIRLLLFFLFYVFYLCMGSLIFTTLEAPVEEQEINKLRQLRERFLNKNRCVNDEDLLNYVMNILKATKHGVKPVRNLTDVLSWNYASAFLYSGTLVTTIGYGDIAPLSDNGKIFTIIFALFGIPMTAVLLTAIVERMLAAFDLIETWMSKHFLTQPNFPKTVARAVNVAILVMIIVSMIALLPALFFMLTEDWGYFESLYFCFITLTTVGLGDYTPGDGNRWRGSRYRDVYKILCVVYFLIGLSFIVLILEMCARVPEDHPGMLFSCHKPMLGGEEENELKLLRRSKNPEMYGTTEDDRRNSSQYQLLDTEDVKEKS